jgi:hypothetical protein
VKTEEIIRNIEKFEDAQILMVTSRPFETMKAFSEKYELAKYPNIIVTQDVHFFLITYFEVHQLPFLAFYDKKKEFISVFNGSMPIEKAIGELRK